MKWLLLVVTATAPAEFETKKISAHETMAKCYFAITQQNFETALPANSDFLCLQQEWSFR